MSSDVEAPPPGHASTAAAADADMVDNGPVPTAYGDNDEEGINANGVPRSSVEVPSTPLGPDVIPASQETVLSTEGPGSPMDADVTFRSEAHGLDDDDDDDNDDIDVDPQVVPSSLTPPSSQRHLARPHLAAPALASNGCSQTPSTQRSATILSPPGTGLHAAAEARSESAAASAAAVTAAAGSSSQAAVAAVATTPGSPAAEYVPPPPAQIAEASADELRAMLQASLAEHTRLKTETAHHKLQYNLLTMQAEEDAQRAAVEHEMTRREAEALRLAESARQARRELSTAAESSQVKYRQLKAWYDEVVAENESLQRRVKLAKRVIQQKEEETAGLVDEKELLLNRLRENREHFHLLCSPGGLFHGAMTPKPQGSAASAFSRTTPYQTPKRSGGGGGGGAGGAGGRMGRDAILTPSTSAAAASAADSTSTPHAAAAAEPFAALLQALNQENNSAPNMPVAGHRAPPRHVAKHVRNVQSMSSLPTTPTGRQTHGGSGGEYAGLLPSVDLVPQTEPAPAPLRFGGSGSRSGRGTGHSHGHGHSQSLSHALTTSASGRYFPETPTRVRHRLPGAPQAGRSAAGDGRQSRESTISADEAGEEEEAAAASDAQDLARHALASPAAHRPPLDRSSSAADEHVFESQASQAASAMLRRDTLQSFESALLRDASRGGDTSAERSAKMQAKLFGGLNKAGTGASSSTVDKRKFSGMHGGAAGAGHGGTGDAAEAAAADVGGDGALRRGGDDHPLQASPTKKVRIVPSLRDNSDSYRHYSYQQRQQELDRVGLGIRYD